MLNSLNPNPMEFCKALDYLILESYFSLVGTDKVSLVEKYIEPETKKVKQYELHISFEKFKDVLLNADNIRILKLDIFLPDEAVEKKNTFSFFTEPIKMNDYVIMIETEESVYYYLIELKGKHPFDADLQILNGFRLSHLIHEVLIHKTDVEKEAFFCGFIFLNLPNPARLKMSQRNPEKNSHYIPEHIKHEKYRNALDIYTFDRSVVFFPFEALWHKISKPLIAK